MNVLNMNPGQASGNGFLKMMSDMSSLPLQSRDTDIDGVVREILGLIGRYLGADRSYFFQLSSDSLFMDNTHDWFAGGGGDDPEPPKRMSLAQYPFWSGYIMRNETLCIPDIDTLPDAATAEKELLSSHNIRSLVALPLLAEGRVFGFIGLSAIRHFMEWDQESQHILKMAGNIIVSAILCNRSERLLDEEHDLVESIFESESLKEALAHGLDSALRISNMPAGALFLVQPRDGGMDLVAHQGISGLTVEQGEHVLAGSAICRFLTSHRSIYFGRTEKPIGENRFFIDENPESLALIPIRFKDQFLGTLLLSSSMANGFQHHVRRQLESVAVHVGLAIHLAEKGEEAIRTLEVKPRGATSRPRRHQSCP